MWNTIFSTLDTKKTPSDEQINKIQSYIYLRWLENHPMTILAANQLNYYYDIPMTNQYRVMKQSFAGKKYQGRPLYIAYPKNTNTKNNVDEIIARHFKINLEMSKEYQEILGDEEVYKIVDMYNSIK